MGVCVWTWLPPCVCRSVCGRMVVRGCLCLDLLFFTLGLAVGVYSVGGESREVVGPRGMEGPVRALICSACNSLC